VFYDMDTPVTLDRLERGQQVPYIPSEGLGAFDLVLSYTGGKTLDRLREQLGVMRAATLYGWVDADVHHRVDTVQAFEADLSYLGTYSADRQAALENLFIAAAHAVGDKRFVIGGAMYEAREHWPKNIRYFEHVAPPEHSAFYSSSPLTLNVTRASMASMGYCPSGRLFEAAACGTAVLSDWWEGLDAFFEPGSPAAPKPPQPKPQASDNANARLDREMSRLISIGSNGSLFVGDKGFITTGTYGEYTRLIPVEKMRGYEFPPEFLTRSPGHYRDWIRACKGGTPACSNFSVSAPFTEWIALGALSLQFDSKLEWDSANMRITNNAEANRCVSPTFRKGWSFT